MNGPMTTTSATDQLESGTVLDDGRQVTVYTPPRTAMPPLRPYLASVWERRALMWQMTRSNLKARHYNTVFGQVWLLVDPLLTAAVFYLLRSVIRPIGGPEERNLLVAHLIMAIFFFFYMSDSVIGGSKSIMRHRQLLLNSPFPRAMFPVTHVLQAIFDFLPMLGIYTILHLILGQPFTWALLWVPVIFVALTMFGLGGALLFSTLSVLYRDVGTLLPYMSRIWMYVTPVLYLVAEIPERFRTALQMNPLYPSFAALEVTFQGHAPPAQYLVAAFAWGIASLLLGGTVFLLKERNLAIRI
jgi:teichoic acid transport system permease protein